MLSREIKLNIYLQTDQREEYRAVALVVVKWSACFSTSPTIQVYSFFKWANPGLFLIYFHLFKNTLQILQQTGTYVKKMSIQYMVLGFELMTFGT